MDNYLDFIADSLCEIARILVIFRYCNIFFRKKETKIPKPVVMGIVIFITLFLYQILHNIWINLIITYLGILIIMDLFEGTRKKKVLLSVMIYVLSVLMDFIAAFMIIENPNADNQNMISSFLSIILFLISVIVIEKIYLNKAYGNITEKNWIYLLVLSITSICSMLVIYNDVNISKMSMLAITAVFVVINFIVYGLYVSMEEKYSALIENQNLKNQLKAYDQQIQLNIDSEKQIRTLKHDMKHHLREIYVLAEQQNTNKIKEYVEQMLDSIQIAKMKASSGNTCIDGIINYMCTIAKDAGIDTKVDIVVPENLELNDYDFNIILGNLFDNAIEASKKVDESYIYVNINYNVNCLFITFQNKYDGIIHKAKKIISTKGEGHGIGLESVKNIVDKYNGVFHIDYDFNQFIVKITLFM